MHRPVLRRYWDNRRGHTAYKLSIDGTSKYLLFTAETLADLQNQINEALKGNDDSDRSK